jgi:RNA polymerase sigma-70 factor, ECF subfamily
MGMTELAPGPTASSNKQTAEDHRRIQAIVRSEHAFVWRTLRRLGVPADLVEDGVQQVFLIVCRRLGDIEAGQERSFLFGASRRVASEVRRKPYRHHEVPEQEADANARQSEPDAERLLQMRRDRELLDSLLDQLPEEHRIVFVLYELEELTMASIAQLLAVPAGTVASRLRRARELFNEGAHTRLGALPLSIREEAGS